MLVGNCFFVNEAFVVIHFYPHVIAIFCTFCLFLTSAGIDLLPYYIYRMFQCFILIYLGRDLITAMQYCRMILFAEILGNLLERSVRHFSAKIHDNLSGDDYIFCPFFRADVSRAKLVMVGYDFYDELRRDLSG